MRLSRLFAFLFLSVGLVLADFRLHWGQCSGILGGESYSKHRAIRKGHCNGAWWDGNWGSKTMSSRNPCKTSEKLLYTKTSTTTYNLYRASAPTKKVGKCTFSRKTQACNNALEACVMIRDAKCATPICNSYD
ncbi:hypothetical protein EDB81DRAFT_909702 [Dactylonectria macrodidyma]|uniref:Secreted protein n=1 Tax=Dactylonectria macrodidyma TaxID=307937 RepID=A0A9P9FR21_9HYPO|nr:hypothetical protein EDB81DRAFT_909702 [Dactylonectria macrodidyma]